jgi:hypothetical protein
MTVTSEAERFDDASRTARRHESLDRQARRRRIKPIESASDLACEGIFDTDEELDEFLAFTHAERQANLA